MKPDNTPQQETLPPDLPDTAPVKTGAGNSDPDHFADTGKMIETVEVVMACNWHDGKLYRADETYPVTPELALRMRQLNVLKYEYNRKG